MELEKMKKKRNKKISKLVESDAKEEEIEEKEHEDMKKSKRVKGRIVNDASASVRDEKGKQKNKSSKRKKTKNKEKNNCLTGDAEEDHTKVGLHSESSGDPVETGIRADIPGKPKKCGKKEKKSCDSLGNNSVEKRRWITEYHQSRPGLKILQQRIDEFIIAHEAQLEQERKEREAKAAEGGWTVVVHHKGRKKTTDGESGITVGSVARAAVKDTMAKKKSKEVGLDFYRFQKREAQRNEIMQLQSKFEQDKKRIQQLRAARKFRPY